MVKSDVMTTKIIQIRGRIVQKLLKIRTIVSWKFPQTIMFLSLHFNPLLLSLPRTTQSTGSIVWQIYIIHFVSKPLKHRFNGDRQNTFIAVNRAICLLSGCLSKQCIQSIVCMNNCLAIMCLRAISAPSERQKLHISYSLTGCLIGLLFVSGPGRSGVLPFKGPIIAGSPLGNLWGCWRNS